MDRFEQDTAKAWKYRLFTDWFLIQHKLDEVSKIQLGVPSFEIIEGKTHLGMYVSAGRVIQINRELLENYPWDSVMMVLMHETAHMIVDVVWKMGNLPSHGEAFVRACKILGIDASRCISIHDLLNGNSEIVERERIVSKVKKLMALTSSSEQAEAELALRKAEEMMLKYNIESLDGRTGEMYMFRPVGPVMKKVPNYVRDLAGLVKEYYFVNTILSHTSRGRYFEFFGTKENLDLAEYIFCCLLYQAEKLWEKFSKGLRYAMGRTRGYASKSAYIEGVIAGYSKKLQTQKKTRETQNASQTALVWSGDPLLEEMYRKAYPTMKLYNYSHNSSGGGYGAGFSEGRSLTLAGGLHSGSVGNSGRLLTK